MPWNQYSTIQLIELFAVTWIACLRMASIHEEIFERVLTTALGKKVVFIQHKTEITLLL